jgi:hypothetical protein
VGAGTIVTGEIVNVGKAVWINLAFFDARQERVVNRISERSARDPEKIIAALEAGLEKTLTVPSEQPKSSKELIRRLVDSRIGIIKYCYERELKMHPRLGGKLVVKFNILVDGSFANVRPLPTSTLKNDAVFSCVEAAFSGLETGYELAGKVTAIYPFYFEPDDSDPTGDAP